jgi:hypothetical protein
MRTRLRNWVSLSAGLFKIEYGQLKMDSGPVSTQKIILSTYTPAYPTYLYCTCSQARSLASLAEQADEPVPDISNQLSGPSPAGPPAKLLVLQVGRLGLSPSFHIQSGFISTTTTVEIKNKMSRCFILVICFLVCFDVRN